MSYTLPLVSSTEPLSVSDVPAATASKEVSRERQKELAAALFKELAATPLPERPEPVNTTKPRVYG
jgi:hypothetical protein